MALGGPLLTLGAGFTGFAAWYSCEGLANREVVEIPPAVGSPA